MKQKLQQRLNQLFDEIHREDFIQQKGLGSEVPYFIFDYDPKDEQRVRDFIQYLLDQSSYTIVEINLFKLMVSILEEEIKIVELFQLEAEEGFDELVESIRPILSDETFIDRIIQKAKTADIVLITGVGSIYPFIRVNEILNRLQEQTNFTKPVIVFYPGEYSDQQLKLFNRFPSDKNYRAFWI